MGHDDPGGGEPTGAGGQGRGPGQGLAGAYGLYTVAAVVSVFFVFKYVHETKGRELEQMQG